MMAVAEPEYRYIQAWFILQYWCRELAWMFTTESCANVGAAKEKFECQDRRIIVCPEKFRRDRHTRKQAVDFFYIRALVSLLHSIYPK